jgi:hypothetical protein
LGAGRLNIKNAVVWAKEKANDFSGRLILSPYSADYSSRVYNHEWHQNKIQLVEEGGTVSKDFTVDTNKYSYGLKIASGDVDGDGFNEIVTASGPGGTPTVKVLDLKGKVKTQFLAFPSSMKKGLSLAVGDINNDNKAEIIVSSGLGSDSTVKIFDNKGKLKKQFLAYDKKFRGGVNVAVGHLTNSVSWDIVTAPISGVGSSVRIFDVNGKLTKQFSAYGTKSNYGVNIAVANIDGRVDGTKDEIIVAPLEGGEPRVKIFDNAGRLKRQFLAYDITFKNGLSLSAGDVDNDGSAEVITGAGPGGAPHVRVFGGSGILLQSFYAYKDTFNRGVNVGFILLSN